MLTMPLLICMEKEEKSHTPDPVLVKEFLNAAQEGDLQTVQYCLQKDYTVLNMPDHYNETALYKACHHKKIEIARYLLQHKDIDITPRSLRPLRSLGDATGSSVLRAALEKNLQGEWRPLIYRLLELGADPNETVVNVDNKNVTPLDIQCCSRDFEELLIEYNADPTKAAYFTRFFYFPKDTRIVLKSAFITTELIRTQIQALKEEHKKECQKYKNSRLGLILNYYLTQQAEEFFIQEIEDEKIVPNQKLKEMLIALGNKNLPLYEEIRSMKNNLFTIKRQQKVYHTLTAYFRTRRLLESLKKLPLANNGKLRLLPEALRDRLPYYAIQKK